MDYLTTYKTKIMPTYKPLEVVFSKGKGMYLYDINGAKYLDFSAGIAVMSMGHSHPLQVKALTEQVQNLVHVSNIFMHTNSIKLADLITQNTFADRVFFCSSGLEANEAALKLARRYAINTFGKQKTKIISFKNSFHGRSLFTVSVGGQAKYSQGFGDLPKDIYHATYNDLDSVRQLIDDNTCAVILEPIQGEGGIIPANKDFLNGVRELCDKYQAVLIFDEVQTGVGRTGTLYSYMDYGVVPDVLTSAKGLGAGVPIGAVLAKEVIAQAFQPGVHGTTFGGNPLATKAALVSFSYFSNPQELDRIKHTAKYLREQLEIVASDFSKVLLPPRGKGLLLGLPIVANIENASGVLQKLCLEQNLLVLQAGAQVLRLAPPLIVTTNEVDEFIQKLRLALENFLHI